MVNANGYVQLKRSGREKIFLTG